MPQSLKDALERLAVAGRYRPPGDILAGPRRPEPFRWWVDRAN